MNTIIISFTRDDGLKDYPYKARIGGCKLRKDPNNNNPPTEFGYWFKGKCVEEVLHSEFIWRLNVRTKPVWDVPVKPLSRVVEDVQQYSIDVGVELDQTITVTPAFTFETISGDWDVYLLECEGHIQHCGTKTHRQDCWYWLHTWESETMVPEFEELKDKTIKYLKEELQLV